MLNTFLLPCFWDIFLPLLALAAIAAALGALFFSYFSGKKIAGLHREIHIHQKNYADLSGDYQATLGQKATLEQENADYGIALEAEKASVTDWTGKHEKLSYSFEVLNKKHLNLFSSHTDLEKKYGELEAKFGDLGRKNLALSNQFTAKEAEAEGFKLSLAEKIAAITAGTLALSQFKDSFSQKEATLKAERAALQAEIAALQQKNAELTAQHEEASAKPQGLILRNPEEVEAEQNAMLVEIETHKSEFDWSRIGVYTGTGKRDNLKRLRGVNPFIEKKFHTLGIYSFRQIANLNEEDQEKLNQIMGLSKKKFQKEEWVFQSRRMVGLILDELPDVILARIAAHSPEVNYKRIGMGTAANKDNLQAIGNISAFDEARLNALGIYKYSQIAAFTKTDAKQINKIIEVEEGRILDEDWVAQAEKLMHASMADTLIRVAGRKGELNWGRISTAEEAEKQDLQVISGIGLFLEEKMYALGIFTLAQIARFHADDLTTLTDILEIPAGQIEGDEWVGQAKKLAKG